MTRRARIIAAWHRIEKHRAIDGLSFTIGALLVIAWSIWSAA